MGPGHAVKGVCRQQTIRLMVEQHYLQDSGLRTECAKIAHRESLVIFTADSGIATNSAMGINFVPFNRRENRRSLANFDHKEIAHLGALEVAILRGSGKNRRRNRRGSSNVGALCLRIEQGHSNRQTKRNIHQQAGTINNAAAEHNNWNPLTEETPREKCDFLFLSDADARDELKISTCLNEPLQQTCRLWDGMSKQTGLLPGVAFEYPGGKTQAHQPVSRLKGFIIAYHLGRRTKEMMQLAVTPWWLRSNTRHMKNRIKLLKAFGRPSPLVDHCLFRQVSHWGTPGWCPKIFLKSVWLFFAEWLVNWQGPADTWGSSDQRTPTM